MKRLNKYMMLFVAAFALVSCVDDVVETPSAESKAGEDVLFGLSLPDSRTVYGNEKDNTFPIYWATGDKVQIYSPECAAGRNDAEYSVTPVSGQSYAEKLTKTGPYGVQWGEATSAKFYSVYPSLNAEFSGSDDAVTAKLHISNTQESNAAGAKYSDMDNVVMYAQSGSINAGDIVNLKYKPYSTVLSFTLNLGQGNNGWGSAKVQSLTLTAPEGTAIAGDFTLKFNGANAPTITPAGNNTNSIKMTFVSTPMLNQNNQSVALNFALIPLSGVNLNGWTVEVEVLEGTDTASKTYKKTLGNGTLAPGKIHKITLPNITPQTKWTYNKSKWITNLYDYENIYITELSLPGAWYAGAPTSKEGYQDTDNIATLWSAGVRAFAVECRTVTSGMYQETPSRISISGTQSRGGILGNKDWVYAGTNISTVIKNIVDNMNTEEFAVLVLSYADGGEGGHRAQDYAYFINGVKNEITQSGVSNSVYSGEVTPDTTVEDVKGKLIIKINVDKNITKDSYNDDMNALFSYNPFMKQLTSAEYSTPLFSKMYWQKWSNDYKTTTTTTTDFLWCFSSANRTTSATSGADIPSYAQRQTALRAMITHSQEISEAGSHNVWFYFNAGGTQTTSQSSDTSKTDAQNFAKTMNPWLLEVIKLKSDGGVDTNGYYTGTAGTIVEADASPLGIVMFNQCTGDNTTYKGTDIIDAIIEMNDKFKLKRYAPNPPTEEDDEVEDDPFA